MGSKRGFTLIEAVFSMLILSLFSVVIVGMLVAALSASHSAKLSNQATDLAEKGVEQSRAYYQNNKWPVFSSRLAGCYSSGDLSQAPFATGGDCPPIKLQIDCSYTGVSPKNGFYPYIQLIFPSSSQASLKSVVSWRDKNSCKTEEVDTYFYSY